MTKIDPDLLSQCCQPPVSSIKELVLFHIVLRINPFFLELPPYGFRNIQMWRIWGQESNEQSPLVPERHPFHYASGLVNTGIIQYQYGLLLDAQRKPFQELNDHTGPDVTFGHYPHVPALPVDKAQYIDFIGFLYRYMNILAGKLPTVRHIALRTNMRFISIIKVNLSGLAQMFEFRYHSYLMVVIFRIRLTFGTCSYPFISSVNTFKKRRRVLSLIDFPRLASHSALAVCRRWRWDLTAASKPSFSSTSKTGFRPCPGLLLKPDMPSSLKRLIQWLTLTLLMPVIKPTSFELRPSDLSSTTWQRVRKQWLGPVFKPCSKDARSCGDSCGVLTLPMPQRYEII